MIETICTPHGETAFPAVVKCDGCGIEIECCGYEAGDEHFCDECFEPWIRRVRDAGEFRICDRCGEVMTQGYSDENADHVCEDCFGPWMDEVCPGGYRECEDDGCGGCYEELIDGEWRGTSIYWTQWS